MCPQTQTKPMHVLEWVLREGGHQQDMSTGETHTPPREWLAEVWAVEQVLFQNLL